jgi:hypothetical protein
MAADAKALANRPASRTLPKEKPGICKGIPGKTKTKGTKMQVRDVMEKLAKCDPYQEVQIELTANVVIDPSGAMPIGQKKLKAQVDEVRMQGNVPVIEAFQ